MTLPRASVPRKLRIGFFLGLIVAVEITLAYLFSWIHPVQTVCFVPIEIAEYQARPLAAAVGVAGEATTLQKQALFAETLSAGTTRQTILQTLDSLAQRASSQPIVLYLSALAVPLDDGEICLLPGDAAPEDSTTWVRLGDVLEKLRACPSRQKLLVLDLTPVASLSMGSGMPDIARLIPQHLKAVPDENRLVLCACAAGQSSHIADETGSSIFSYYFREALRGLADGWDGLNDGHVTVKELTAFVRHRVERWSLRNRGERQTPILFGSGRDFSLAAVVDSSAPLPPAPTPPREYPAWLLDAWKDRDALYQTGQYRLSPRLFRQQQAMLLAAEQACFAGVPEATIRKQWLPESERLQESIERTAKEFTAPSTLSMNISEEAKKTFDDWWRKLPQQLTGTKPAESERIKHRMIEELRTKLTDSDLDAVVFAHAHKEGRLDPATVRLYDRILHATPQTAPRTSRTLRLRQLADLAMRVEVFSWPSEAVETLLRATDLGERAVREDAHLTNYHALLFEPTQHRHAGEIRLWTRGFASVEEAKQRLALGADQFDHLLRLNDQRRRDQKLLDEALIELPEYVGALDVFPQLQTAWERAAVSARLLAQSLRTQPGETEVKPSWKERIEQAAAQEKAAEPHARALRQHLLVLREPFLKEDRTRLERQCRSPHADAGTLRSVESLLRMAGPKLRAEDRASLRQAAQILSRRLHEETLDQDRVENETRRPTPLAETRAPFVETAARRVAWQIRSQLALLELGGVSELRLRSIRQELDRPSRPDRPTASSDLGAMLRHLIGETIPQQYRLEKTWQGRERLAWMLPPLDRFPGIDNADTSPSVLRRRDEMEKQQRWLNDYHRHLARDYHGLNLESPGILAARGFYAQAIQANAEEDAHVRLKVLEPIEPLTRKQPYAHLWVEVARWLPAGKLGPVELQFHRGDGSWLEVAPESAMLAALRASGDPRTLTNKVPLKVTRLPLAERSGLPPPAGFLIEARLEGRSYHHLAATPIPIDARDVQILVSTDAKEPTTTVNDIRVRPGKMKQPYYFYVKNLTNRPRRVHVEVSIGETLLHKSRNPLVLEPDGIQKVSYDDATPTKPTEIRGSLQIRVLDQERDKVLETRTVRVEILSPHEYVKVADVSYMPGREGGSKWIAQVQTAQQVTGPAIAAELVLPIRRIPGLLGVGGGTLQVELPTHTRTSRMLFAEKIRMQDDGDQEGPVYLNIDGVPRAFVYRTTFARYGAALQPDRDDRPAVRLVAPGNVMAGVNYLVDVEVDNAPVGAKLEVLLGRTYTGGTFKAEVVREYADAKQQSIGMETTRDSLLFDASIKDWTATFDTRSIVGTRELRARLLDANGKQISVAVQPVVIDNTPPIAQLVRPAAQIKRGAVIPLLAQGQDEESGIAKVVFFLGRPDKGEIPPGAVRFQAIPTDQTFRSWTTSLPVPLDHKGTLPISVHVVNGAGMSSVDTVTLEVIDGEPGKTGRGQIFGRVLEGPRPQPNLVVTLTDERGTEIARTRTRLDGTFVFEQLPPGRYRLLCVKPESLRRALQGVIVEPDRMAKTELSLSL